MTQLQPHRHFIDASYKRNWHYVAIEANIPFDAILEPGFWAHISAKMAPFDIIEVDTDDSAYTALLKVRDAGKLYARVEKLIYVLYADKDEVLQGGATLEGHMVKFRGPVHRWCVVRGADVLKDAMTKEEAYAWLGQYAKSIG